MFMDISAFGGEGSLKSSMLKKIMETVQNLDQLDKSIAHSSGRSESSYSRGRKHTAVGSPLAGHLSLPQSPKPIEALHSEIPGQRGLTFSDFVEVLYLAA